MIGTFQKITMLIIWQDLKKFNYFYPQSMEIFESLCPHPVNL